MRWLGGSRRFLLGLPWWDDLTAGGGASYPMPATSRTTAFGVSMHSFLDTSIGHPPGALDANGDAIPDHGGRLVPDYWQATVHSTFLPGSTEAARYAANGPERTATYTGPLWVAVFGDMGTGQMWARGSSEWVSQRDTLVAYATEAQTLGRSHMVIGGLWPGYAQATAANFIDVSQKLQLLRDEIEIATGFPVWVFPSHLLVEYSVAQYGASTYGGDAFHLRRTDEGTENRQITVALSRMADMALTQQEWDTTGDSAELADLTNKAWEILTTYRFCGFGGDIEVSAIPTMHGIANNRVAINVSADGIANGAVTTIQNRATGDALPVVGTMTKTAAGLDCSALPAITMPSSTDLIGTRVFVVARRGSVTQPFLAGNGTTSDGVRMWSTGAGIAGLRFLPTTNHPGTTGSWPAQDTEPAVYEFRLLPTALDVLYNGELFGQATTGTAWAALPINRLLSSAGVAGAGANFSGVLLDYVVLRTDGTSSIESDIIRRDLARRNGITLPTWQGGSGPTAYSDFSAMSLVNPQFEAVNPVPDTDPHYISSINRSHHLGLIAPTAYFEGIANRYHEMLPFVDTFRVPFNAYHFDANGDMSPESEAFLAQWFGAGRKALMVHVHIDQAYLASRFTEYTMTQLEEDLRVRLLADVQLGFARLRTWLERRGYMDSVVGLELMNEPASYYTIGEMDEAGTPLFGAAHFRNMFTSHVLTVARQVMEWWRGDIYAPAYRYNANFSDLENNDGLGRHLDRIRAVLGPQLVWSWHCYPNWAGGSTVAAKLASMDSAIARVAPDRVALTETNIASHNAANPETVAEDSFAMARTLQFFSTRGVPASWFPTMNIGSSSLMILTETEARFDNPHSVFYWLAAISEKIHTTPGSTVIVGDVAYEATDPDRVAGSTVASQIELLYGGAGADTLTADSASATMAFGGAGNDALIGNSARRNWLYGGTGNDTLTGAGPSSYLEGGPGDDVLILGAAGGTSYGGAGNNTFVLVPNGGGAIYAFEPASDRLDVSQIAADQAALNAATTDNGSDLLISTGSNTVRLMALTGRTLTYAGGYATAA